MRLSAWIERIEYEPLANRRGVLTLHLWSGAALVYGETGGVPSWLPGLLHAHRSPGRAFNLLVKDQGYSYRRVEAPPPEDLTGTALEALLTLSLEVLTHA
jgi:hypothetical protein